jgi:hypothetical protein
MGNGQKMLQHRLAVEILREQLDLLLDSTPHKTQEKGVATLPSVPPWRAAPSGAR